MPSETAPVVTVGDGTAAMPPTQCRLSIAIAIVSSLFAMACSNEGMSADSKKICARGGTTLESGQSTPSGDGCNTCVCQADGGFACTTAACPPDAAADARLDLAPGQMCIDGGKTYAIGESFKQDCNTCTCTASGIACTLMGCQPLGTGGAIAGTGGAVAGTGGSGTGGSGGGVDVGSVCALSANLTFGRDGGNSLYWDVNHLTASAFTLTRNYSLRADRDGAATATCSPSLPPCGSADLVTLATINADLALPDVQALWSLPQSPVPLFGTDSRPMDGTVYSIALDDGRKVLVGGQCASPTMSSCRYIPAGLVSLTQDLQKLATAMLADPVCKNL